MIEKAGLVATQPKLAHRNMVINDDAYASLKTLPDCMVDVGITSPPYNKQESNAGGLVTKVVYEGYQDKLPESEYQDRQVEILDEVYRATKDGGSFFYNHKIRWVRGAMIHPMDWLRRTKWCIRQEIVWDRTLAGNIRGWRFWQVEERVYWLYKPVNDDKIGTELASKDAKLTSIWRAVPETKNPHPAPFPLWLPVRIILSIMGEKQEGLVLDPFCGSGTTLVAAKLLGLDFLGIEISNKYVEWTKDRLANCEAERHKLQKEQSLHVVNKTFSQRKMNGEYKPRSKKSLL